MANQNVKGVKKSFSHFAMFDFFKFRDNCEMEYAKKDCFEKLRERKKCMNRHREHCKFNKQCKCKRKGTRQFLHSVKTNTNKDKLTEYICQIDAFKKEI